MLFRVMQKRVEAGESVDIQDLSYPAAALLGLANLNILYIPAFEIRSCSQM